MRIVAIMLSVLVACSAGSAMAVPVRVDYANLIPATFDGFEDDAPGTGAGLFDGFRAQSTGLGTAAVSDAPPCAPADRCFAIVPPSFDSDIFEGVEFSDFLPGTRSFGVRLPGAFGMFAANVQGIGGSAQFVVFASEGTIGPGELGFFDASGLSSVSISGPLQYDDVITSSLAPVPLPPPGAALLLALGGLVLLRRKRGLTRAA